MQKKTTLKVLSFGVVFSLCLRLKSAGQKFSCFRKSLSSTLFMTMLFAIAIYQSFFVLTTATVPARRARTAIAGTATLEPV